MPTSGYFFNGAGERIDFTVRFDPKGLVFDFQGENKGSSVRAVRSAAVVVDCNSDDWFLVLDSRQA